MTKVKSLSEVHMDLVKLLIKTSNVEIDIIYVAEQACVTSILLHLVHHHVNIYSLVRLFPKK